MDKKNFEQQLNKLENRVAKLEKMLKLSAQELKKEGLEKVEQLEHIDNYEVIKPQQKTYSARIKTDNWLGIIAIICFVFAAGFIIKISIETGWFTPLRQIITAAAFGIVLICAGMFLLKKYNNYASLLPAAGVIILYLSAFAANRLYALIAFPEAIALTILISALCIWLYRRLNHDIYAISAAIGAYVAPLVLNFNAHSIFSLYYFLCCSLTFATLSVWLTSRSLNIIGAYLAISTTYFIGLNLGNNLLVSIVLVGHFIIFALGNFAFTVFQKRPLSEGESWAFFPVLLWFYAAEYYYLERIHPGIAPWLSLLFAGILIGIYLLTKREAHFQKLMKSQQMLFAFVALVFFHSFYLEILPLSFKPWLFIAIILSCIVLPLKIIRPPKEARNFIVRMVVIAIILLEYWRILTEAYEFSGPLITPTAAVLSIWLLLLLRKDIFTDKKEKGVVLISAHLLAITGLYNLAYAEGSLMVSACWLLYAMIIMALSYVKKDKIMAQSALLVLGFSAGKALLFDAARTPTFIRILCLILTGVFLYIAGLFMKKIARWPEN